MEQRCRSGKTYSQAVLREYRRRCQDDVELGTGKVMALQIAGRCQEYGCLRACGDPGDWDRVDRDDLSAVCRQALRGGGLRTFSTPPPEQSDIPDSARSAGPLLCRGSG